MDDYEWHYVLTVVTSEIPDFGSRTITIHGTAYGPTRNAIYMDRLAEAMGMIQKIEGFGKITSNDLFVICWVLEKNRL